MDGHKKLKNDKPVLERKAKQVESMIVDILRRKDALLSNASAAFGVEWAKLHAESDLFTHLFLLRDGVVVVRYRHQGATYRLGSSVHLDDTLETWTSRPHVIPWGTKMMTTPIKGGGSFRGVGTTFGNSSSLQYYDRLLIDCIAYDSVLLKDPEQTVLTEFQLLAAGYLLKNSQSVSEIGNPDQIVAGMESVIAKFESLLLEASKEEQLQKFLRENSILFGRVTELISKQKLGEDFVTDFVIKNVTEAGVTYTLVEIEKPSKPVFTSGGQFSAEFTQAMQQTISWSVWLDDNIAYLRQKLPGLKAARFMLVIGRSLDWTEEKKAHFDVRNRGDIRCEVVTYDGLLVRAKELLSSLRSLLPPAA